MFIMVNILLVFGLKFLPLSNIISINNHSLMNSKTHIHKRGFMECPNCYFDNRENVKVCENCGEIFKPASIPRDVPEEVIEDAI